MHECMVLIVTTVLVALLQISDTPRPTMDDDDRAPPHEASPSGEIGAAQANGGGDNGDGVPSGDGPISLKGVFLGNL
jgi:hypothetical protein